MFPDSFLQPTDSSTTPASVTVGPTSPSTSTPGGGFWMDPAANALPSVTAPVTVVTPIYKRPAVLVGAGAVTLMIIGLIAYSHSRSTRNK